MTWLLRFAALVAAFFLLRWLWGWFWRTGWKRLLGIPLQRAQNSSAPPARHGTAKRDPVCGTFVDVELSVRESAGGETLHFCSERCRDAYRARQPLEIKKTG